jgi:hypothetical protein
MTYKDGGIVEGTFWRPTFTQVLVTFGTVPVEWIHAWRNMQMPVNSASTLMSMKKMEIGVARCEAVKRILALPEHERPRYILWLSDDDLMPWNGLVTLFVEMERHPEWDVLTSIVHLKNEGHPPSPVLWRWDVDHRRPLVPGQDFKAGSVVESHVANLGFGLTRPELFERLPTPYFKTGYEVRELWDGKEGITLMGEDCYFFEKVRAIGGKIGVHTGVRSSHLDVRQGVIY